MLIAVERARAAVWDAARALSEPEEQRAYAVGVAAVLAADAAVTCAEGNIQIHGGIGYTYEHDAHLVYRRALTLRALLGRASAHRAEVAALAVRGVRRPMSIELDEDAEPVREEIRARVAELAAMEPLEQRAAMAAGGWVTPHLPEPWGRGAGPLEQIVIQQELKAAKVRPVPLMIAAWVVPSLVQYGTPEQRERFLPPTLRGEIIWCQLFSEPGAGSDLAGLRTRAERAEGGWTITGQKIWTSLARDAQWGICIARTDPDRPKHDGITYFLVDMKSPGIEIRPLRECTGDAVFNEVFLDGVFVPDDLVVGPVNAGWRVARTTLANERVGLTSSFQLGGDLPKLLDLTAGLGLDEDPVVRDGLGRLACDEHSFNLLGLRATLKQLSGTDPGATANVRKLVAMEHGQQVTEFGFTLLGEEGALTGGWKDDLRARWTRYLLASRAMTIGGGTTEVNLNVIGERILGLPRDPEPVR
jgi:alkylation response protein AidB-like acyl-CoA dehydrogenase